MAKEIFTVSEIVTTIFDTARELNRRDIEDPNGNAKGYGGTYVRNMVYRAIEKARKDGGSYWKVEKPIKANRRTMQLDADHTTGVFDALGELVSADGVRARRMRGTGFSAEVLWKAEETLFELRSSIPVKQ